MPLFACQNEIPVIAACPPSGAKILLFDVTGPTQYKGMALMDIDVYACCVINKLFGAGTITIKGSDLVAGLYYNSNFIQNLQVFAWNIPNYLIREGQNGLDPLTGQWRYILNGSGKVIGLEIYGIGYSADDLFTITPNATCNSIPSVAFTNGINTRVPLQGVISGVDAYDFEWTQVLKDKYGMGSFLVYLSDGIGGFNPSGLQPVPDDSQNPTKYTFNFGFIDSFFIIS